MEKLYIYHKKIRFFKTKNILENYIPILHLSCLYDKILKDKRMGEIMEKRKQIIMLISSVLAVIILFVGAIFVKSYTDKKHSEKMMREHYESRLDYFETDNKRYSSMDVDVAFIGDSLIEEYELTRFYPQYVTANRGINGDTTLMLKDRLKVSLYDLQPKVCVMLIGINDYEDMFDNYEQILKDYKTNLPATKIVLMSLLPTSGDMAEANPTIISNNKNIKELASKYGYTYIDVHTPLLDTNTKELNENYTYDGVHLTLKGYQVITDTLTPQIKKLLSSDSFL